MKYLVDTNIWLELLLEQEKARSVRTFLLSTDTTQLSITDFTLYPIGIILLRLKRGQLFQEFISDILDTAMIPTLHLESRELKQLPTAAEEHNLDFDDAYQYVASEKYDLMLVSFDTDFDTTPRKRKTPEELLNTK